MKTISSHDDKLSFAESLLQQKKFHFQKRNGRLDLRGLREINVNKVISEMDVDTLQRYLENLTYSEVCADDFRLYSEDCLVRLFQIAQLTLEYLLNVQDTLAINLNSLAAKYANQKRDIKVMQQVISDQKRIIDGFPAGTRETFEPTTDDSTEEQIIVKAESVQKENFSDAVNQNRMCSLLTTMRDEIVVESKRNFEAGLERVVKPCLSSLACQQSEVLKSFGEEILQECRKYAEDEADRIVQSLGRYLSCHQNDIIVLALKTYAEEKYQKNTCTSCQTVADTGIDSDEECNVAESSLSPVPTQGDPHRGLVKNDDGCSETALRKGCFSDEKSTPYCSSATDRGDFINNDIVKSNIKNKRRMRCFTKAFFLPCRTRRSHFRN